MQRQTKRRILIVVSSAFLLIVIFVMFLGYSLSHAFSDRDFNAVLRPVVQQASVTTSDVIAIVPADDLANLGRGRSPRFLPQNVLERKEELATFALSAVRATHEANNREIPFVTNTQGIPLCVSGNSDKIVIIADKKRAASDFCKGVISSELLNDFPESKVVVMRSGAMLICFTRKSIQ
jgi:hypothetical protein